jgi:serpin B
MLVPVSFYLSKNTGQTVMPVELNNRDGSGTTNMTASVNTTVGASNRFTFDLYNRLRGLNGNLLFSPYSISTALSMVYEGARGTTADEMQIVFHFNANTTQRLNQNRELIEFINQQRGCNLSTANALWVQNGYPILPAYRDAVTEYCSAEARELNLAGEPEKSRTIINGWVENKTNNKVKELFPSGSFDMNTRLVLTNAIYFKGNWLYQFDPKDTGPQPFTVSPGQNVNVDMMSLRDKYLNYTDTGEVQVLELPYANSSISMFIILPKSVNITDLEHGLSLEQLNSWLSILEERKVDVYLPKFKGETSLNLRDTLAEMGMPTAFNGADFTGINSDGGLSIDKVFHKAVIEVNEKGTEAAEATGTVMTLSASVADVFKADHPFVYLIRENSTGQILFIGRLIDPNRVK